MLVRSFAGPTLAALAALSSAALLAAAALGVGCSADASREGQNGRTNPGGDSDGFGVGDGGVSDGDFDAMVLDPEKDNDGDGYLYADDCNDRNREINPGAYDVPGDGVDNDCNGKPDDTLPCDTASSLEHYRSTDAMDFARALGLCRIADANAEGTAKTWGVIDAQLLRADGSKLSLEKLVQHGLLKKFGSIMPREGTNIVVLSSGTARTPDYPEFQVPRTDSYKVPLDEVTPPTGHPKNFLGCPFPDEKTANDSINLKLTIRVPTNAKSFFFDFDFFSSEYLSWVCSSYNDSFVAILKSRAPLATKHGGNVSFDANGNPVNVNSGFFEVCRPGTKGAHTFECLKGVEELIDTGFDDPGVGSTPPVNGSTSWLTTQAPVIPGETITLQFMIWDTGDHALDSTVLLDNFRWDAKPTTAPVTDRPK